MTTNAQMPALLAPPTAPPVMPSDAEIADAILRRLAIRLEAQRLAGRLLAEERAGSEHR